MGVCVTFIGRDRILKSMGVEVRPTPIHRHPPRSPVVCERSFVSRTAPLVLPVLVLGPRETDGRRLVQSIQLLELYTVLKRGARLGVDEGLDRPLRRSHEYPSWMQLVEVVNSPPPNHLPRLHSRNPTQKPLRFQSNWLL